MPNRQKLEMSISDAIVFGAADMFGLESKARETFIDTFPLSIYITVDVNDFGNVTVVSVDTK